MGSKLLGKAKPAKPSRPRRIGIEQEIALSSPFVGKREFLREDGTPFWQYLQKTSIPFVKADFPFLSTVSAPQVKKLLSFAEFLKLSSRGEALATLYQALGKTLNYVGPVLDSEMKHGFNDHTDRHTLWVSQTGVELLQRSGMSFDGAGRYDSQTEILMTLVGMLHDIGNLVSRKNHSTYSAWLVSRLFAKGKADAAAWRAVLHAILFHEEPVLVSLGLNLAEGTPLQWALVAADKMHVGRDRIGTRSFQSGVKNNALEDDVHILINALIVRSSWHLGVKSFVWDLDFSVEQLEKKFESFTKGNRRIWLPQFFQSMLLSQGIIYRESFCRKFRRLYLDRMEMLAQSVFLLFPFVERLEVRLIDNDMRNKVGSGEVTVWVRKRGE